MRLFDRGGASLAVFIQDCQLQGKTGVRVHFHAISNEKRGQRTLVLETICSLAPFSRAEMFSDPFIVTAKAALAYFLIAGRELEPV